MTIILRVPAKDARTAADAEAQRIAGDAPILRITWPEVYVANVGKAGAVIVQLHNGYTVHGVCARGIGALQARVYAEGKQQ